MDSNTKNKKDDFTKRLVELLLQQAMEKNDK